MTKDRKWEILGRVIIELTDALGAMIDAVDDGVLHVKPSDREAFLVTLEQANDAHSKGMSNGRT